MRDKASRPNATNIREIDEMLKLHGHKVLAIYSDESNKYIALRLDTNNTGNDGFIVAFGPIRESGVIYSPHVSEPVTLIFNAKTKGPIKLTRIDEQNNP